jgi:hypothetical protein
MVGVALEGYSSEAPTDPDAKSLMCKHHLGLRTTAAIKAPTNSPGRISCFSVRSAPNHNGQDCIRSAQSVSNAVAFGYMHLACYETEHFGYNLLS